MQTAQVVLDVAGHDVHVSVWAAATRPAAGGVVLTGREVAVAHPGMPDRFYRHGWQSWSPSRWLDPSEPVWTVPVAELHPGADDPAFALCTVHGGADVGALDAAGTVLLLGALGLGGRVETDGARLTGASAGTDEWFVACGAEDDVFAAYADQLAKRLGSRTIADQRVWCSWYSFYRDITEARLDAVIADLHGLAFDVVQVDDGWQRSIGDWVANDDFPSGMPALASRIREAGYEPGLWMAPFLAQQQSELFGAHREWLLRDDDGALVSAGWNWDDQLYAIDVTHPDALAWIVARMQAAVDWGFAYLKLDFLYAGALPGVRHSNVERHSGYRRAVQAIRDAVGDDVLLLACGAPIVASVGVFDAIRIGPDVAELWENHSVTRYLHHLSGPQARYAVATSAHRLWLRPLIGTDPDVAYFRSRACLLTAEQKQLIIDLTRACRFRATSDIPATLDADERAALAAYLGESIDVDHVEAHRWRIDGRDVDFGPVATAVPDFRPLQ